MQAMAHPDQVLSDINIHNMYQNDAARGYRDSEGNIMVNEPSPSKLAKAKLRDAGPENDDLANDDIEIGE